MALNVIKISRVSPATQLVDPLILPLTFFDFFWLKLNPTKRITFYRLTESSRDSFYSVILPKLELSLSLVLTHFLPLTGHLKWDPQDHKPHIIVLPQDSVSLTVSETEADFSLLSSKGLRHQTELLALAPELPVYSDSASVFTLQITLFPNQGFCIGITLHHAAMDGKTVVRFLRSWAHICKHGSMPQDFHLPMLLDRTAINVPAELESKIFQLPLFLPQDNENLRTLKFLPVKNIDDVLRITLELTLENVKKLRERAKTGSTRSDLHLSTFVVTYAYVLTCMVKARGVDAEQPVPFTYVADFRDRLDPPVPVTYFGNCVLPIHISSYKAKTDSIRDLSSRGVESIWELYEEGFKKIERGTQKLIVAGSNKFKVYGTDFGWGRPVSTENISNSVNVLFSLSERRDETGGAEISMCLKKCEMDVFVSVFQNGL
ncbi:hypothetical protein EUTSA_v10000474mg [Eutrema salsugineum]|uniref:BAHD acyltransferase n=1 Tax=Eutrema salsugineum TaxID=72664 RepID=V4LVX9_EUTSA|nr:hypothetical protein EUTSA_v10000474mg [Eutrema salsugineum]